MTKNNDNKVTVNIFGEEYPIVGASDPSYISRIADMVDSKMKETAKNSKLVARDKVAILTAMSMASELYEKKGDTTGVKKQVVKKVDSIIKRIDQVL